MASSGVMLLIELVNKETAGPVGPDMAWGNGMAFKPVGNVKNPRVQLDP